MTTQKRKVTAKVTNTTTSDTTEEKVKPAPRTRTTRAKAKPAETSVEEKVVPEVKAEEDKNLHEVETESVELSDKQEEEFPDEDEVIATEVGALEEEKKLGSKDFTIAEEAHKIEAINGNSDGQYPLHVWTRDSKTLLGLHMAAVERANSQRANPRDYWMMDYAEQNAILNDPHMASFFAREGAKWANFLTVGDRNLRSSKVNYSSKSAIGNTERVVSLLMRRLELGVPIIVRLWHSGIVFSINPPDKAERIALVDQLSEAHLDTLRRTNGLIHGTSSYYANRLIINEFMRHVTSSNIDKSHWPDIINLMDHRDIQFMAWGIMAASYARGYHLSERCGGLKDVVDADGNAVLNSEGKTKRTTCGHVNNSIIDFHLLCQIDNSAFTDWQRDFIAKKIDESTPVTLEDIEKYQSQGEMHKEDRVEIDDGLCVILKAPKANLHIEIGERWINSVEKAVNQIISSDSDDVTKNTYIDRQLEATSSMDVAHWVKGFELDGELIDDREGIERIFRSLGNNLQQRDDLFDKIRSRMSKRLAAVIAVPTFKCPECKNLSNEVHHTGTVFYTPLDMVSRFFTLTVRSR